MRKFSLLVLICLLAFSACKKEDEFLYATIHDGGEIELDGCGWLIETSAETFKPQNLPDEFKIDGMEVKIKYDRLNSKSGCGFVQELYFEIYLTEIQALIN